MRNYTYRAALGNDYSSGRSHHRQRWILNKITEQKPAATSARNAAVE
jgi:hypothetical protein